MSETIGNPNTTGGSFIHSTLRLLVDEPEKVHISEMEGSQSVIIEASVASNDMRRVIGRKGRSADALREILLSIGGKENRRYVLALLEPDRQTEKIPALPAKDE